LVCCTSRYCLQSECPAHLKPSATMRFSKSGLFKRRFALIAPKTGRLPTSKEGLAPLVATNLLERLLLKDPWGYPYEYNNDTGVPEILSLGRDGMPGGEGLDADISSWELGNDREPP